MGSLDTVANFSASPGCREFSRLSDEVVRRADNLVTVMCRLSENSGGLNFVVFSGPSMPVQE
jgi:hypothetical protein